MSKVPKLSLQYFFNILKKCEDKLIFWMKLNIKVFYKLTTSFLLAIARYVQSNQNSKFVISLQYLFSFFFLHKDKHQTFRVVDPRNLGVYGQACPNYPK